MLVTKKCRELVLDLAKENVIAWGFLHGVIDVIQSLRSFCAHLGSSVPPCFCLENLLLFRPEACGSLIQIKFSLTVGASKVKSWISCPSFTDFIRDLLFTLTLNLHEMDPSLSFSIKHIDIGDKHDATQQIRKLLVLIMSPNLLSDIITRLIPHTAPKLTSSLCSYDHRGLVSMTPNNTLSLPGHFRDVTSLVKGFTPGSNEEDKHLGSKFSICLSLRPPSATGRNPDSFSSICTGTPATPHPVFVQICGQIWCAGTPK